MSNDLHPIEARERAIASLSVGLILAIAFGDILFDRSEGVAAQHLAAEAVIIMGCLATLWALWWGTVTRFSETHHGLSAEMSRTRSDLNAWRTRAQMLLAGLGEAIKAQFDDWRLTEAEQEVGLLLLKGLGLKEIAAVRATSEKTVRHQAAAVYRKAKVQGRSELAAFFLEDLLLPLDHPHHPGP